MLARGMKVSRRTGLTVRKQRPTANMRRAESMRKGKHLNMAKRMHIAKGLRRARMTHRNNFGRPVFRRH